MKKMITAITTTAALLILSVGASFATAKTDCCPGKCCPNGACCRSHHHAK